MNILKMLVVLAVVGLAGCSMFENMAAPFVASYCAAATDGERAILRARVNGALAPNSVEVTCAKPE